MSESTIIPKVWVTKYYLAKGVQIYHNVERCDSINPKMISVSKPTNHFHKPYWHESELEANQHVAMMAAKKIRSLTAQQQKLQKIGFAADAKKFVAELTKN